jgi:hypothetical protein
MARFQLAVPAANVSKFLYGESRKSYQSPNAQYNISNSAQFLSVMVQYVLRRIGPRPYTITIYGDGAELAATASSCRQSLSLAAPQCQILLVRARAYKVTVQFPKEVVRSDRRARAAARCMVKSTISLNCT